MQEFSGEYSLLFNAITDALSAMSEQEWVRAQEILIRAQQRAEAAYLDENPRGGACPSRNRQPSTGTAFMASPVTTAFAAPALRSRSCASKVSTASSGSSRCSVTSAP